MRETKLKEILQKLEQGLCPVAEYLQPRMVQLKTNYWNLDEAKVQSEILHKTLNIYFK